MYLYLFSGFICENVKTQIYNDSELYDTIRFWTLNKTIYEKASTAAEWGRQELQLKVARRIWSYSVEGLR